MNKSSSLIALFLCALPISASPLCAANQPNVIFILADDMGIGDVSHTTGKAPTRAIDRLAKEGMRFIDAHTSSSVCTPTRYSLLTGRYSWRTRLKHGVFSNPKTEPLIEEDETTVAHLFRKKGYRTGIVGKWHLGFTWQLIEDHELDPEQVKRGWDIDFSKPAVTPTSNGVDHFFGILASLDMPPYVYVENDRAVNPEVGPSKSGRKGPANKDFEANQCLKVFAQKSIEFIEEQAETKQPFFLYVPLTSPHSPVVPSEAWIGQSGIGRYGDFLMETDWVVDEILHALDKHKLAENTLVVFSTDNGVSTSAKIPHLIKQGHYPSGNLRGTKADIYEGGHRVPFVVRWPGRVAPGTVTGRLTCQTDFFATCAEILGVALKPNEGVDSVSFLQTLQDGSEAHREAIVHHSFNGSFAIRQGKWKLCLCKGSGGWSDPKPGKAPNDSPPVQLYDLDTDIGESKNLALEHPEKVRELTALLQRYVDQGRSTPGEKQALVGKTDIGPRK